MSRMIPSQMSDEQKRKSNAEWTIFEWLREMEWGSAIVLYSLPLKEHVKKSFGEIDFVVICEKGVLCIEVKGGKVCRQNGKWQFINRFGHVDEKPEGPYTQAQGNMKSLKKYLEDNLRGDDPILKASFACCVMMPECVVSSDDDTEIIREITFDQHLGEKDMVPIFERSFRYWEKKTPQSGHKGLSQTDRERLATFLRGDFSFVPKLSLLLKSSEEQLCTVTDQQFLVIAGMSRNDRMMIEGGAGTGKTFLATEQCKKYSIIGDRVLFLCFNSLIANFLREAIKNDEVDYRIDVMTFHEMLMKLCGEKKVPENIDEKEYFDNFLPNTFLSNFASLPEEEKYDRMVIDEGQDLMNLNAYMCLDNVIKGGWKNGKWAIYYDPKQNIFNTNEEFSDTWKELKADSFIYPLTVNCRNTRQIAKGNFAVTHVYNPPVMQAEGEEIEYIAYKDKKDELKLLWEEIRKLRSGGISKKEIVILSYYRNDNPNSCLYQADIPSDIGPISYNVRKDFDLCKNIRHYTIKTFKGMEAKVVIMIDVDSFSDDEKRLQNYVGMSRAKTYLAFLYNSQLSQERQQRLLESLVASE